MNNVEQIYQGDGKFTWTNGDTYEGAWASDAMSGFGTTKYANGNVYSGEVACVCVLLFSGIDFVFTLLRWPTRTQQCVDMHRLICSRGE